jgi:phage-related protein
MDIDTISDGQLLLIFAFISSVLWFLGNIVLGFRDLADTRRKYTNGKGKGNFSGFLRNLHEITLSILAALRDTWKDSKLVFVVMMGCIVCLGTFAFLLSILLPWSLLKRMDFLAGGFYK